MWEQEANRKLLLLGVQTKMENQKLDRQIIGNIGLFYVCYELSKRNWNVLLTSRNTKGIDVLIYNQSGKKTHTIQVKALSDRSAISFGKNLDNALLAEYLVICRDVLSSKPEIFIEKTDRVKEAIHQEKDGTFWLEYKKYENFSNKWEIMDNS